MPAAPLFPPFASETVLTVPETAPETVPETVVKTVETAETVLEGTGP